MASSKDACIHVFIILQSIGVIFLCEGPFYGKSTKNNVDNANSASYVGVFEANSLIRENNYWSKWRHHFSHKSAFFDKADSPFKLSVLTLVTTNNS